MRTRTYIMDAEGFLEGRGFRYTSGQRRKQRRDARRHAARCFASGLPERAEVWLKRARNG